MENESLKTKLVHGHLVNELNGKLLPAHKLEWFKNASKEDIRKWAETNCNGFEEVINDGPFSNEMYDKRAGQHRVYQN